MRYAPYGANSFNRNIPSAGKYKLVLRNAVL